MREIGLTEQEWQERLIDNASYDSDWIGQAAKLLASDQNTFEISTLEKFSPAQLKVMVEILADENTTVNMSKLLAADLNATQMRLYWMGLSKGISEEIMDLFLDSTIPYAKTNFIVQALIEGHTEITNYIDDYSATQIAEICTGMSDGIDYTIYANPAYSSDLMNLIRHAICTGISMELLVNGETIFINQE